uniref:VWFA domain-containing protein n=1 Tax=Plectus sambesii TaxID=2011161 RepID=A0A914W4T2_9BILA
MIYDIFVILDDSGNSNTAQFLEMQSFLIQYLSKFTYSSRYTQVSYLSVSKTATDYGPLGLYAGTDFAHLIKDTYQAQGDNLINLRIAFQVVIDLIKETAYRPSAHHLIVYITTTSYTDDPLTMASQLRNQYGQSFLSIAYGSNADVDKLAQLSGGYDCVIRAGIPGVSLDDAVLQAWNKTCSYAACNESATTTPAPSTISSPPPLSCDTKLLSNVIYLVIDASSAVSDDDYDELRNILVNFVSGYTVSNMETVFALIHLSDIPYYFPGTDLEYTVDWIMKNNKGDKSGQNLNEAFLLINSLVKSGAVPADLPQVVIYISGTTEFTENAPYDNADILVQASIKFLAVQYEQQADLNTLAYLVGGENCVYSATNSDSRNGMAAWLQNKTCTQDYCNASYTTISTAPTVPLSTAITTLPPDSCPEDMIYDIFVILDDSGNSNTAQFLEMQSFLIQYLSKFTYSPSYTQVSFLSASSTAMATGTLGFYKDSELAQIIQYTYQSTGDYFINIQSAFRVIVDMIKEKEYRPSAHHLILYITTTSYTDDPLTMASQLRNQYGQSFLTIAYGSNADVDKLAQLSGGYDCVLRAGVAEVSVDDVVLQAWNKTCSYISCNESAPTTTAASTVSSPSPHSCDIKSVKYMIYLVVDDSSAVSKIDYDQLRTFLTVFASEYTVADDNVIFTLITVSHEAMTYLLSPSVEDVVYTLINHNKQDGMGQNLNEAFLSVNQVLTMNLVPPGTPQLLIYISGTTEFSQGEPYDMASTLNSAGIKFVAVQYGPQADLSALAYLVGGEDCVYSALDSDSRDGMVLWLQNKTCNEDYCNITVTPSSTTASMTSSTDSVTSPPQSCPQDMVSDVYLVLDQSLNADATQFSDMKEFLIDYTRNFTFDSKYSRFSFITISDFFGTIEPLGMYNSVGALAGVIRLAIQSQSTEINLGMVLNYIKNSVPINEYRPDAHRLVLYITAAGFTDDPLTVATQLRNERGFSFITVAYGEKADVDQLAQLSGGYDCVIKAGVADASSADGVQTALNKTCSYSMCNESVTTASTTPPAVTTTSPPPTSATYTDAATTTSLQTTSMTYTDAATTTSLQTTSMIYTDAATTTSSPTTSKTYSAAATTTSSPTTSRTDISTVTTMAPPACPAGLTYDVFVFLDCSNTANAAQFLEMKTFIRQFIANFTIGPTNSQFLITSISDNVLNFGGLNTYKTYKQLSSQLNLMIQQPTTSTDMELGLQSVVIQAMNNSATIGYRQNANHLVFFITAGSYTDDPVATASSLIKQHGFGFMSIAYGPNADLAKLGLFSGGSDCVIKAGTPDVDMADAVQSAVNKTCSLKFCGA